MQKGLGFEECFVPLGGLCSTFECLKSGVGNKGLLVLSSGAAAWRLVVTSSHPEQVPALSHLLFSSKIENRSGSLSLAVLLKQVGAITSVYHPTYYPINLSPTYLLSICLYPTSKLLWNISLLSLKCMHFSDDRTLKICLPSLCLEHINYSFECQLLWSLKQEFICRSCFGEGLCHHSSLFSSFLFFVFLFL